MYVQLAGDPKYVGKNLFFSPFSLSSALAVTYEGARGVTADEIRSVCHFPNDTALLRDDFSQINAGINSGKCSSSLNTANALWGEKTYTFRTDYISTAERWYSVNVTNLDFINQPEDSRQMINNWVAYNTKDKINDLLPAGTVTPLTRLVITNAVYFKDVWAKQFKAENTKDADFHVLPEKTVTVRMMEMSDKFPYAETANLQMLSLPYSNRSGNNLSMIILLPKSDSLAAAESALEPENLSRLERSASVQQVSVYFPKFRFDTQYLLRQPLTALGMPTAFTNASDFSGMDGSRNFSINDVIHNAFVNVDEEGTEAAAATAVVMAGAYPGEHEKPVPVFRADHPFVFLIQDNNTGAILFLGRVSNPTG
jgi:serpin B